LPDFDKFYNDYTKVYPLTGAVAQTMHYKDVLRDEQILIVDEIKNMDEAIKTFETNLDIKFFDPLACPGGCVGGP
jgi:iron only hydrogenase large subunit-like protein